MSDPHAMLTVEPEEPVIHDVRLQQAYRTTVTLRNHSRNALELTVRAGSPERWAVAPATVFLEAGRTMRVDLRLKLTRELRPRRLAGGAGATNAEAESRGAHRQRDVFHVKSPFFEQRFHASFVTAATDDAPGSGAAAHKSPAESAEPPAGSFPPPRPPAPRAAADGRGAPAGRTDAARDATPTPTPTSARIDKRSIRALDERLEMLERENRRKDLDARDKDALIRALTSRLERARADASVDAELRERAPESSAASASSGDPSAGAPGSPPSGGSPPYGEALRAARRENAELAGANAALRGRLQELDGEAQAARRECAGLRRRARELEAEKVPELADLVASALEQERSAFEAQSLKALRVLEAKDQVLASRERETAEARAEAGALSATLEATRRELDACEGRLASTLEEQVRARAESERERAALAERAAAGDRERETLRADLDAATAKMRESAEALRRAVRTEEDVAFLRAEAETAQLAAEAAREEAEGLKRALKNVAELRRSEREALASRVAHAERERVAAQRAASADGLELLTAEIKRAHEDIAATLEASRGDEALRRVALRNEPAGETEGPLEPLEGSDPPAEGSESSAAYLARAAAALKAGTAIADVPDEPDEVAGNEGPDQIQNRLSEPKHVTPALVRSSSPDAVAEEVVRLRGERDAAAESAAAAARDAAEARRVAERARAIVADAAKMAAAEKRETSSSSSAAHDRDATSGAEENAENAALRLRVAEQGQSLSARARSTVPGAPARARRRGGTGRDARVCVRTGGRRVSAARRRVRRARDAGRRAPKRARRTLTMSRGWMMQVAPMPERPPFMNGLTAFQVAFSARDMVSRGWLVSFGCAGQV